MKRMKREIMNLTKKNDEMIKMIKKLEISEEMIHSSENRLSAAERFGSWCAYQDGGWTYDNSVIIFNAILHADSNMNTSALNMETGKNYMNKK